MVGMVDDALHADLRRMAEEAQTSLASRVATFVLNPYDRATLRYAVKKMRADSTPVGILGGVEIRANPFVPEGLAAMFDGDGELLGIMNLSDHSAPGESPPSRTR